METPVEPASSTKELSEIVEPWFSEKEIGEPLVKDAIVFISPDQLEKSFTGLPEEFTLDIDDEILQDAFFLNAFLLLYQIIKMNISQNLKV